MTTDFRALCEELLEALTGWHQAVFETGTGWARPDETYLLDRARAALAEPEPPAEGEVAELVEELRDEGDARSSEPNTAFHRAADLLSQRHPAPVPVSERLPHPEDCDAEGRCWLWRTDGADEFWELVVPLSNIHEFNLTAQWKYTHWLPATALPLPQGEVE